jgi:hypothetical protein
MYTPTGNWKSIVHPVNIHLYRLNSLAIIESIVISLWLYKNAYSSSSYIGPILEWSEVTEKWTGKEAEVTEKWTGKEAEAAIFLIVSRHFPAGTQGDLRISVRITSLRDMIWSRGTL